MSTQYIIMKDGLVEIYIDEASSEFRLVADNGLDSPVSTERLSAEELVIAAVRMIQPALYNVEDPKEFLEKIIMREIGKLFV